MVSRWEWVAMGVGGDSGVDFVRATAANSHDKGQMREKVAPDYDAVSVSVMSRLKPLANEALADLVVSMATKPQCFRLATGDQEAKRGAGIDHLMVANYHNFQAYRCLYVVFC
ncbi:hypothetical protein Drorol1_Dr00021543 [Drosera rotundifolia]